VLIQDDERRRLFGDAGRKRVEKLFDLRLRTEKMEELYARVLKSAASLAVQPKTVDA